MSFRAGIKAAGESGLSYNGLHFSTHDEAVGYAKNLYLRWTMMTGYEIEETADPVNYQWTPGGLAPAVPVLPDA